MAAPKRRQCGTQQVHERLCEDVCRRSGNDRTASSNGSVEASSGGEAQRITRQLITIPVVVHVVYKTAAENISDAQVKSQIDALNRDYGLTNTDREAVPTPWKGWSRTRTSSSRSQRRTRTARRPTASHERRRHATTFGTGDTVKIGCRRRTSRLAGDQIPESLGLHARRRPARLRAVPRRARQDRRRRHPQHRVRDDRDRGSAVQPRPHRDPRGRALAQPAPHLGRPERLRRHRLRHRHAQRAAAELRQADLPASLVQQRAERRHVHELHGLRRRRRDGHVHRRPGRADERHACRPAQEDRPMSDRPGRPAAALGALARGGHRRRAGLPAGVASPAAVPGPKAFELHADGTYEQSAPGPTDDPRNPAGHGSSREQARAACRRRLDAHHGGGVRQPDRLVLRR